MFVQIEGAPYPVRLLPAIPYGVAPDVTDDEGRLLLDLLIPRAAPVPRPAVIYICSEGWESHSRNTYPWISPLLAAHGFVAASVTHRTGDVAAFPAQLHDAKAAVRWLRANASTYDVDPDRIGVWGDSAGGHLAALLGTTEGVSELEGDGGSPAASSAVQAVVMRCAPTDFRPIIDRPSATERLGKLFDVPDSERAHWIDHANPITYVRSGLPPFLIVHGTEDEVAPYAPTAAFAAALQAHGNHATLHTVDGRHHNLREDASLPWSDDPWETLGYDALSFFTDHLGH